MAAAALTRKDFDVFAIEGFAPRMDVIKASLRPKLVTIAERLAPRVSELVGREMFVHVARHARRTVNPPPETWAAFAHQARGYKKLPHFALCVSKNGALARMVLKDEALEARARLAKALPKKAKALGPALVKAGVRDFAGWDAVTLPDAPDAKGAWIAEMLRHASLKTGVFDAGIFLGPKVDDDAVLAAFEALLPIYSLAVTKK